MTVPSFLPDWVPSWVQLVLLVGVVLVVGAYLVMPFSVFGVKARLDALDERLDEMQGDLRALANRLPDPEMRNPAAWRRGLPDEDGYVPPPTAARRGPAPVAPATPDRAPERERGSTPERMTPGAPPLRPRRSEPQLNWPENRPRG